MEEDELNLSDLVELETLQKLQSLFEEFTGVPMVFVNPDGTPITEIQKPLRFCGSLVSGGETTLCLRRAKWDEPEEDLEQSLRQDTTGGGPVHHRCRGGFRDTAAPIVVEDRCVGLAVFARSMNKQPDIDRFRRLAEERGMEPQVGEDVADAALVMTEDRLHQVAEFVRILADLVATAAYETIRAEQIIDLEQQRDALTHMIVHDLRTPLTSIIGGLQTIVDTNYDGEMVEEFVPSSLAGAQDLLEMVNTLLDIDKMESGEMELEIERVELTNIAADALDQVRGLAREHGHNIEVDIDKNCPPLKVDAEKLQRVMVNLLGNAIKFTPEKGNIKLAGNCGDSGLEFLVIDDGPGIPEQEQQRIFEKFGQAQARQEGHKYSTGLGLTFCKMVAEAHGGRISVESEVGEGSKFTVSMPLSRADDGEGDADD